MSSARRLHHTYEEYVRFERESPTKHEYCDGEISAMAGGTPEHSILGAELIAMIRSNCRPVAGDDVGPEGPDHGHRPLHVP